MIGSIGVSCSSFPFLPLPLSCSLAFGFSWSPDMRTRCFAIEQMTGERCAGYWPCMWHDHGFWKIVWKVEEKLGLKDHCACNPRDWILIHLCRITWIRNRLAVPMSITGHSFYPGNLFSQSGPEGEDVLIVRMKKVGGNQDLWVRKVK